MSAAKCTLTPQGATATVTVRSKINVCYVFNTAATKAHLELPYAHAINGKTPSIYEQKAKALTASNRTISVVVESGAKVSLYLNSDAHPKYRRNPVYEVEVKDDDIRIEIEEVKGIDPNVKPIIGDPSCITQEKDRRVVSYKAKLTGDIWMKISHRYSVEEATELLPQDLPHEIRSSILSIYRGLAERSLTIDFPPQDGKSAYKLYVSLDPKVDENVRSNISFCPLLTETLPRVHPLAYAALLQEAYNVRVTELRLNSTWRPMFGEIVHRAGLGIDVCYASRGAEKVTLARKALTSPGDTGGENVTAKEKALYNAYIKASLVTSSLRKEMAADAAVAASQEAMTSAKKAWDKERDQNEPRVVHDLRERLGLNKSVTQVLDPWYVDVDTHDKTPPVANTQSPGLQSGHNNHLHITIDEPGLP